MFHCYTQLVKLRDLHHDTKTGGPHVPNVGDDGMKEQATTV